MLELATLSLALLAGPGASAVPNGHIPVPHFVANLNYRDGGVSVFEVTSGGAHMIHHFVPVNPSVGSTNGLALYRGQIYTAINSSTGNPCASCFEVLKLDGTVVSQTNAPILSGAPGAPQITDLSLNRAGNVFLSDFGQQAVYWYALGPSGWTGPNIVAQNSTNAASVATTPNAKHVYISGGCGFASARLYTRTPHGETYTPGGCFSIGTIAFIGTSVDHAGDIASPVDGAASLVSIGNPDGKGISFMVPHFPDGIGSVSFSPTDNVLYVADATQEVLYEYQRPIGGWVSAPPQLIGTIRGFKGLDIISTSD